MMHNYLKHKHQQNSEKPFNFYTPQGLHVYIKDEITNDSIDLEKVMHEVESLIPSHLFSDIEMIIVGWFSEFEERDINAFYIDGTLCITNTQDDEPDMIDDIVHEIAHAAEHAYGYEIYADNLVKDEFLRKRKYLHDILWNAGYKAPEAFFADIEFNQEFDDFLHKDIGYGKLSSLISGLFITPYAATSLNEYYATAFTDYFIHPDERGFLKKVSPQLYKKLILLQDAKTLDRGS